MWQVKIKTIPVKVQSKMKKHGTSSSHFSEAMQAPGCNFLQSCFHDVMQIWCFPDKHSKNKKQIVFEPLTTLNPQSHWLWANFSGHATLPSQLHSSKLVWGSIVIKSPYPAHMFEPASGVKVRRLQSAVLQRSRHWKSSWHYSSRSKWRP